MLPTVDAGFPAHRPAADHIASEHAHAGRQINRIRRTDQRLHCTGIGGDMIFSEMRFCVRLQQLGSRLPIR
jgi:hypothetical protein